MHEDTHHLKARRQRQKRSQKAISRDIAQLRAWTATHSCLELLLHGDGYSQICTGELIDISLPSPGSLVVFEFVGSGNRIRLAPERWVHSRLFTGSQSALEVNGKNGNGFTIRQAPLGKASALAEVAAQFTTWAKLKEDLQVTLIQGAFIYSFCAFVNSVNGNPPNMFILVAPGPLAFAIYLPECQLVSLDKKNNATAVRLADSLDGPMLVVEEGITHRRFTPAPAGTA